MAEAMRAEAAKAAGGARAKLEVIRGEKGWQELGAFSRELQDRVTEIKDAFYEVCPDYKN